MPTDAKNTLHNARALEFKSSTFSAPVLIIASNDLAIIGQQLQQKVKLAPEFFRNSPIVLDVQWLNKNSLDIDFSELAEIVWKAGLLPIGIRGGSELQNNQALALRIPVYSAHNAITAERKPVEEAPSKTEPVAEASENRNTTLITHPVRSGQRIYATGDLIILAQVSAGAEIIAEGNIHVYNTLRGRALAGVQGDVNARIFCSDLEAELISIAGTYKVSEDMRAVARNKPVQIFLQEHTLIIEDIA